MTMVSKSILALAFLFTAGVAQAAGLPEGDYTGFVTDFPVGNNPYYCRAERVNLSVVARDDAKGYRVQWEEQGRRGGFGEYCYTQLDADFRATKKENEWDVRFLWANDLIFGKAKLKGDRLVITATLSGGSLARFETTWGFSADDAELDYSRMILGSGPTLRATGTLHRVSN
jgi:hypothetical protein